MKTKALLKDANTKIIYPRPSFLPIKTQKIKLKPSLLKASAGGQAHQVAEYQSGAGLPRGHLLLPGLESEDQLKAPVHAVLVKAYQSDVVVGPHVPFVQIPPQQALNPLQKKNIELMPWNLSVVDPDPNWISVPVIINFVDPDPYSDKKSVSGSTQVKIAVLRSRSRSWWSRNYFRPGTQTGE